MVENILSIDLGRKSMGIALSRTGLLVTPIDNPHFKLDDYQQYISYLKKFFLKERVEHIVIGYPLYPSGDPCKMTPVVDNFIELLKENFPGIEIIKQDERESTKEASTFLSSSGYNMKKQRKKIDCIAACVILERYLHSIKQI